MSSQRHLRRFIQLALLALPTLAGAGQTSIGVGYDASRGKYGDSTPTDIEAAYAQVSHDSGAYSLKLLLPYLSVTGPAGVIGRGDALIDLPAGSGERVHAEGPGDVVVSLTQATYADPASGWAADLAGKLKLPTADSRSGLGTGKYDFSLGVNAYKDLGDATLLLGAAYKWLGKPAGSGYRDVASAILGMQVSLSADSAAGGIAEFRQSALAGQADQVELTAYLSLRLSEHGSIQLYVYGGSNSASPEIGGGALFSHHF